MAGMVLDLEWSEKETVLFVYNKYIQRIPRIPWCQATVIACPAKGSAF